MKKLENITQQAGKYSPEFYEELETKIVAPIEKLGAKFIGYGAMGQDSDQAGFHMLIFDINGEEAEQNINKILELAEYNDEGTNSTNYQWFGTLYLLIPMPY